MDLNLKSKKKKKKEGIVFWHTERIKGHFVEGEKRL